MGVIYLYCGSSGDCKHEDNFSDCDFCGNEITFTRCSNCVFLVCNKCKREDGFIKVYSLKTFKELKTKEEKAKHEYIELYQCTRCYEKYSQEINFEKRKEIIDQHNESDSDSYSD